MASYNQPGGNATGINVLTSALEPKRLGILHQLLPRRKNAVLPDPNFPSYESQLRDAQEAARAMGLKIYALRAATDREIEAAFETVAQEHIAAITVAAGPFFDTRRNKLVALADAMPCPRCTTFANLLWRAAL